MNAQQKPTTNDLVARCRQMADKAHNDGNRARPGADELENLPTATETVNPFKLVPQRHDEPTASFDIAERFAGSDADALFDVSEYGSGRRCNNCSKSLDGQRIDARFCSDSCRTQTWHHSNKAPHAHETGQ